MNAKEHFVSSIKLMPSTEAFSCEKVSLQDQISSQEMRHNDTIFVEVESVLEGVKQVWREIYDTAKEVAMREPLLMGHLQDTILNQKTPTDMLAAILSCRLYCADISKSTLFTLISDIYKSDECIQSQATADIMAVMTRDPACPNYLHVLLNLKGFQALQVHRISHRLWQLGRKELAFTLSSLVSLTLGVDIHPAARIGSGVMLDHGLGIVIGETTVIEDNVSILQNVTLGGTGKEEGDRHPKIRSGVMIGAGAKILGNIEIGTMSKVAAGSIVLKDVPPHSTVAGVPAKVVRRNSDSHYPAIEMQQNIR